MSAATDLLAAVNTQAYDASTNPAGLHDGGYLQEVGGVSLVARVLRAVGDAAEEIDPADFDATQAQSDADAIAALVTPSDSDRQSAEASRDTAVAALPVNILLRR